MEKTDNKIYRDLRRLGISANYRGEKFLYSALDIIAEDPTRLCGITKEVYPDIADEYNTTVTCVERNLRTFFDKIWEHKDYVEKIAHKTLSKKPCNREFIDLMAVYLYDEE